MFSNFPTKKLTNLGGLRSFKFIPDHYLLTYPVIRDGQITSALSILPGKTWFEGYATPETLDFNEDITDSENGPVVKQIISGFVPGDDPVLVNLLRKMVGVSFCVQFTNPKNEVRIAGTNGYPLTFSSKYSSGSARADSKGFRFEFSGESIYSAPAYKI
jgi:hypothetical protein